MKTAAVRALVAGSFVALALSSLTGCCVIRRMKYGPTGNPPPSVVAPELQLLAFTNYRDEKPADAAYSGTDAAGGSSAASFDPVTWSGVAHAITKSQATFTLDGSPVHPRPTGIRVAAGSHSGVVSAGPGRFITAVKSFLYDYELAVQASQDDGTPATVVID